MNATSHRRARWLLSLGAGLAGISGAGGVAGCGPVPSHPTCHGVYRNQQRVSIGVVTYYTVTTDVSGHRFVSWPSGHLTFAGTYGGRLRWRQNNAEPQVGVRVAVTITNVQGESATCQIPEGPALPADNRPFAAPRQVASPTLVAAVTSVPRGVFNAIGRGNAVVQPERVTGVALRKSGKPELLWIGAEYCPYCAMARWGLVTALSRFGHFAHLHTIRSSSVDVFPNTATFTFYQARYTSPYLTFVAVEHQTNIPGTGNYASGTKLQSLTPAENALWGQYGAGYPFIDVSGRFIEGPVVPDQLLSDLYGKDWTQIAAAMRRSSSTIAKDIIGEANLYTAEVCRVSGGMPSAVCRSPGATAGGAGL